MKHLPFVLVLVVCAHAAAAQVPSQTSADARTASPAVARSTSATTAVTPPHDYVIGADDVLAVVFWRDKDMSADVTVRPDGRISLPLLNDIQAVGLTPAQLRDRLTEEAKRYVEDPAVTVIVKQINSRKVYVTGEVTKPGPYPLSGPATVLQMIATAGGLQEYADSKNIVIMRPENGRTMTFPFNYKDVIRRKNLSQNIELKPGDTIVVP